MIKRTVLVILHEPQLGGASQSILRATEVLATDGWRFVFWVPKPSALYDELVSRDLEVEGAQRFIDFGLRSLGAPPGPRRRITSLRPYLRELRAFARDLGPDLVHANSVTTLVEGLSLHRDFPVVLHVHEMVPGGVRGRLIRSLAWSRLSSVVAVSNACAQSMSLGTHEPRIVYEAAPVPERPLALRGAPEPFIVGSIGVVSRRKGTDLFVKAARIARRVEPRLQFELVGAPTDERDRSWAAGVLAEAMTAGVAHTRWEDASTCFERWDAFALPSRRDPFPIAMLEAMAHGLPVVGTSVDGLAEQITPDCGLLVPGDDAESLAEAFLAISRASRGKRTAMGAAGRKRVERLFTVERQAAALGGVYAEVAARS